MHIFFIITPGITLLDGVADFWGYSLMKTFTSKKVKAKKKETKCSRTMLTNMICMYCHALVRKYGRRVWQCDVMSVKLEVTC